MVSHTGGLTVKPWELEGLYVCDSVYLYDLFKRRPAPGLGTRSRSTGMGKTSRAYFLLHMALINELNCKIMDREERLRWRTEYERARRSAETAEQNELRLSRRREADRARRAATYQSYL